MHYSKFILNQYFRFKYIFDAISLFGAVPTSIIDDKSRRNFITSRCGFSGNELTLYRKQIAWKSALQKRKQISSQLSKATKTLVDDFGRNFNIQLSSSCTVQEAASEIKSFLHGFDEKQEVFAIMWANSGLVNTCLDESGQNATHLRVIEVSKHSECVSWSLGVYDPNPRRSSNLPRLFEKFILEFASKASLKKGRHYSIERAFGNISPHVPLCEEDCRDFLLKAFQGKRLPPWQICENLRFHED